MDLRDSVRLQVRAYPGGVDAIAARLQKSPETLRKELAGAAGFKLGADDAAEISAMCMEVGLPDAHAFITAWAARMGLFVIPLPDGTLMNGDECMQALADASREMHELMAEVMASLADGSVSDNELQRTDRAAGELVAKVQTLRKVLAARNAAGKPLEAA